jgi:hypothetical protein
MATSNADKLKIKEGYNLVTINAPADFKKRLEPLPGRVKISSKSNNYEQIHWFLTNKEEMEKDLNKVLKMVKENVLCWIYYPKGSSKIQTNLSRDKGWDALLKHEELQWISLISFDDVWSSFGFRQKTLADKKKEDRPKERPIFDYIDSKKKIVHLPDDFAKAIEKNKKNQDFFNNLSFTNRKEYVEWIVTAKREETRKERITGSVERLGKGWKNPRNL